MIHLRIVAPTDTAVSVLVMLDQLDVVTDIVHIPNSVSKPRGDLIMCHVPRESGSEVVDALRTLGIDQLGSIALSDVVAVVSPLADAATERAAGTGSDAVIWQAVQAGAEEQARLSTTYLAFIAIAGMLATIGLLTDSLVLIIGAMVVGPEFGPLAALCVALLGRNWQLAGRALVILVLGFAVAIVLAFVAVQILQAIGLAPLTWEVRTHPMTAFVAKPDAYAGIIAALAGIAGMLSVTTSHSGVLVGVFISVTTIPAAGNIALAAAYGDYAAMRGAALQLGINVGVLVIAGVLTVVVQRNRYARRFQAAVARVPKILVGPRRS